MRAIFDWKVGRFRFWDFLKIERWQISILEFLKSRVCVTSLTVEIEIARVFDFKVEIGRPGFVCVFDEIGDTYHSIKLQTCKS